MHLSAMIWRRPSWPFALVAGRRPGSNAEVIAIDLRPAPERPLRVELLQRGSAE